MIIGCFALIQPFSSVARQFELISGLGVAHADITDNHDGASLGVEYGFSASVGLDDRPSEIARLAAEHGLELTSVCAHANLLDPPAPQRYGTHQIIKAIRLANLLGVKQVITTEGDPKTAYGRALSTDQRVFAVADKLYEPVRWAADLGIELLIEPHGVLTDSTDGMQAILDAVGHEETLGINLDTGNSWLGGGEPLDFVKVFGQRIRHVHWKDIPESWAAKRGTMYGCGMGEIPLGQGVVDIQAIVEALGAVDFEGPTTLEVAGEDNMKRSIEYLRGLEP